MKTINEIYKELKQLRDSLEEYIKTNDTSAAKAILINNLKIYNDILNQLEESGILEKDKEIKELRNRVAELETSVDYWQNEVFKKIEVKLTGVTKEKIQEIRKQVCDEIRNSIEVAKLRYMWEGKSLEISKILDKIEKGEK